MAKVYVFETREQLEKACEDGKLKPFTVNGKFVAARSVTSVLYRAWKGGALEVKVSELGKATVKAKAALDSLSDEDRAILIAQYVKGKKK
jgi:hypothetical protein